MSILKMSAQRKQNTERIPTMYGRSKPFILLLIALMLVIQVTPVSAHTPDQFPPGDVNRIVTDLSLLEPYVHYVKVKGVQIQVLDTEAALAAGFSGEVILLANEMVAYQNDLMMTESKKSHPPKAEKYPKVKQFFDLATSNLKSSENVPKGLAVAAAAIPPCGNWSYPVPNYTPAWSSYTASNPANRLISIGFHNTAGYACGYANCSTADFTRGRSYAGPYGTCSSPRFRDHGRVTGSTSYSIQYGEPNPEVLAYSWPYWNWGSYVQWWHANY
jgi:hypothetical protein